MQLSQTEIQHFVFFPFPPAEVFELLTDGTQHAAFSNSPAQIDARPGGKFSLFDGHITGVTVELEPASRLVQDWRSSDWPGNQMSRVSLTCEPANEGRCCALALRHSGIPQEFAARVGTGWSLHYWGPMSRYLRNSKVAVVRRFLEQFKNEARLDVVDETWTADCVLHVPGYQPPPGRAGQKEVGKQIFKAFSNVHVDCLDTIVEGDRVVDRHRATAVHSGEFMGFPASGKPVYWTENHIYRLKDGLIA